jgi:single-stranded-DNA-specific exonuclease
VKTGPFCLKQLGFYDILKIVKTWLINPENSSLVTSLVEKFKFNRLLARVLINRGLDSLDTVEKFLNPRLVNLSDPFEIPNIEAGARRVLLAREKNEKVVIFGDYDVDGVTGTAILLETFKQLGIKADYYIPHRYGEGYSMSLASVRKIAREGARLIVTVDCGIASFDEVKEANALGVEVVITDHHNLPDQLPPAQALVNPKLIAGDHPSRYLCGAGVAFKFAWALMRLAGYKDSVFLSSLLDLAALGTIADVVPMTGENRILAVAGLALINERKRIGVKHLAEAASLHGKISVNQINFGLAPRINAAGRLEHASKSLELLISDDHELAREMAQELSRINSRRQDLGSEIKEAALAKIKGMAASDKILFLSGSDWHPGVIGIVAAQLADQFGRPTVLLGINNGVGRGSARSIAGVNIFAILDSCRDLYLDFGGHEGAAGFEIETELIPELEKRLKKEAEQRIKAEDLMPRLLIDAELDPKQLTLGLVNELRQLQPFGEGNEAPVFMIGKIRLTELKKVGSSGKHLKLWFEKEGINFEAIGFGMGCLAQQLDYDHAYDIAFNLESNEYNGFESVQLSLIDIREANEVKKA